MKLFLNTENYIDTNEGIDLSLPIRSDGFGAKAWYVSDPIITPVESNGYIGSVAKGGSTNFRDIQFNPHGHGTHTECLGHITNEIYSINQRISDFHFNAQVITLTPKYMNGDYVVYGEDFSVYDFKDVPALIIRTLPNGLDKKTKDYSNSNPPYFDISCVEVFNSWGVQHLLVDLPSVDREVDQGILSVHNAFWNTNIDESSCKTISEFLFIPDEVKDGAYVLNLQIASFENDAAPSRPVIYRIKKEE